MDSTNFIGQNYEITLKKSIQDQLNSLKHDTENSEKPPNFTTIFHQLMQCQIDPPLETIWFYTALTFLNPTSPKIEPLEQFSAIKDLYELTISCSASCNPLKCITLIAPVIYNLHTFIVDFKSFQSDLKTEKKVKREIKDLAGSILGYVNVCCNGLNGNSHSSENTLVSLTDLTSIWTSNTMVEKSGFKEFFPLLSEEINFQTCDLNELAGFVIAEAFFLNLCLKLREGISKKELQSELKQWIIGSITVLQNSHFFLTLLMMLLEPSLPVMTLLDNEAELFLRNILYDAVILPDYSFLTPEKLAKYGKRIAMSRLMVIHEAIESLRKLGEDHTKVISYTNAFSNSDLPSHLLKWVKVEYGIDNGPNGTSPKAYLRWILNLENRGLRIFDDETLKKRAKLIVDNYEEDVKDLNEDLGFYIDSKGNKEEEKVEDEDMNEVFITAAQTIQVKRKGKDCGKKKKRVKKSEEKSEDDLSSDSEVDDPLTSDEEEMEV